MPYFGRRSKKELGTAHKDLQRLFNEVIKIYDCSVLCGHRNKKDQEKAFENKTTLVHWPDSKHNKTPSLAVDVVPYPIDWKDEERFLQLARIAKHVAKCMKIRVKWGGDWKNFRDLPHWQIV